MDAAANADGLAKDIDPAQKPDRPRLLIIVKEERLLCTTHSASLHEQPNGWWI